MTDMKPITLYSHATGPNPWKVVMVLEELEIPFETIVVHKNELKAPAYESININGRVPAITDPNTSLTLWESGAIIEYLVETYDCDNKISFRPGTPEYFHAKQWLFFQVSGQGPYFGQAAWFKNFHPEKIQSAQDRYINEIARVSSVLDRALEGKQWLVGEKYSYADIVFVSWYEAVIQKVIAGLIDIPAQYKNLHAWLQRIKARLAVAKALQDKAARTAGPN